MRVRVRVRGKVRRFDGDGGAWVRGFGFLLVVLASASEG